MDILNIAAIIDSISAIGDKNSQGGGHQGDGETAGTSVSQTAAPLERSISDILSDDFDGVAPEILEKVKNILEQRDLLRREVEFKDNLIQKMNEDRKKHDAYPVWSREAFLIEVKKRQRHCIENGISACIFLIRLNNYPAIRRQYGARGGEDALYATAALLSPYVRDADMIGYVFEYTFALFSPFMNEAEAEEFSGKLEDKINSSPHVFKGRSVPLDAAIAYKQMDDGDLMEFIYNEDLIFIQRG